ncbi:hypothetical protein EDD15DRAFT_2259192 [Pisolithus albus]|nr:hypothetical protein EDD15DRAFT_2259192 [Pisolithus albus]
MNSINFALSCYSDFHRIGLRDMPTPLPPNPFLPGAFHAVYQRCLALETEVSDLQAPQTCPARIACARFLGSLLRLAPADNGQSQVQRDIVSAVDNVELLNSAGNI